MRGWGHAPAAAAGRLHAVGFFLPPDRRPPPAGSPPTPHTLPFSPRHHRNAHTHTPTHHHNTTYTHQSHQLQGIVFSVRPPKKSWKHIANLSGGEKTLSSLALVFALHHFKPTPLYVMDEIDAALDFKNVSIGEGGKGGVM